MLIEVAHDHKGGRQGKALFSLCLLRTLNCPEFSLESGYVRIDQANFCFAYEI